MLAVLDVDFCRFLRILKVVWGFKGFTVQRRLQTQLKE